MALKVYIKPEFCGSEIRVRDCVCVREALFYTCCWFKDQDMSGQTIAPSDDAGRSIPADHTLEDTWKVRHARPTSFYSLFKELNFTLFSI